MRKFLFSLMLLLMANVAFAGWFSEENNRISSVVTSHDAVGTTTDVAIASASVTGNIYGFEICNDPVNASSTYLSVGLAADVTTDGVRLGLGKCYICENCKSSILKLLKVEGQGASNGYSVIQFKR